MLPLTSQDRADWSEATPWHDVHDRADLPQVHRRHRGRWVLAIIVLGFAIIVGEIASDWMHSGRAM